MAFSSEMLHLLSSSLASTGQLPFMDTPLAQAPTPPLPPIPPCSRTGEHAFSSVEALRRHLDLWAASPPPALSVASPSAYLDPLPAQLQGTVTHLPCPDSSCSFVPASQQHAFHCRPQPRFTRTPRTRPSPEQAPAQVSLDQMPSAQGLLGRVESAAAVPALTRAPATSSRTKPVRSPFSSPSPVRSRSRVNACPRPGLSAGPPPPPALPSYRSRDPARMHSSPPQSPGAPCVSQEQRHLTRRTLHTLPHANPSPVSPTPPHSNFQVSNEQHQHLLQGFNSDIVSLTPSVLKRLLQELLVGAMATPTWSPLPRPGPFFFSPGSSLPPLTSSDAAQSSGQTSSLAASRPCSVGECDGVGLLDAEVLMSAVTTLPPKKRGRSLEAEFKVSETKDEGTREVSEEERTSKMARCSLDIDLELRL